MHLPRLRPRRSCGISLGLTPRLLPLGTDLASFGTEGRQETVEAVGEMIGGDRIDDVLAALLLVDQSRVVEDRKMLGDRRHRHVELGGDLTDRHRTASKMV